MLFTILDLSFNVAVWPDGEEVLYEVNNSGSKSMANTYT